MKFKYISNVIIKIIQNQNQNKTRINRNKNKTKQDKPKSNFNKSCETFATCET